MLISETSTYIKVPFSALNVLDCFLLYVSVYTEFHHENDHG